MKSDLAISVKSLSKKFYRKNGEEFFALQDVSFEVKKGETLGVIGANGSGKSTLLKILSGILRPDEGEVRLYGDISSVLDIGSGFHPDLTGLENVTLKLQLMGREDATSPALLREIGEFSELGDFLEMPVKQYSSGMFLRLAFSIFFVTKSEIVLIDEVLSAGDLRFQNKIKESGFFEKSGGILVSHELDAIAEYCDRIIILEKGQVIRDSDVYSALNEYRLQSQRSLVEKLLNGNPLALNNEVLPQLFIEGLKLSTVEEGEVTTHSSLQFELSINNKDKEPSKFIMVAFVRPIGSGGDLHGDSPFFRDGTTRFSIGAQESGTIQFTYPKSFFGPGVYSLSLYFSESEFDRLDNRMDDVAFFEVGVDDWEKNTSWKEVRLQVRTPIEWSYLQADS